MKKNICILGYEIIFDSAGSWSFDNDTAWNVIIFEVDNSYHLILIQAKILILGEGPAFGINESFSSPEKKFSINFSKAKTKFCLSLNHNANNSYLFVNGN